MTDSSDQQSSDKPAPIDKPVQASAVQQGAVPTSASPTDTDTSTRTDTPQCDQLQAHALELLLRSPRLSVEVILRLLDITEPEFRALVKTYPVLSGLLQQRSQGLLELPGTEPRKCAMCSDWFLPYAGDRWCSDECKSAARIERRAFRETSRSAAD